MSDVLRSATTKPVEDAMDAKIFSYVHVRCWYILVSVKMEFMWMFWNISEATVNFLPCLLNIGKHRRVLSNIILLKKDTLSPMEATHALSKDGNSRCCMWHILVHNQKDSCWNLHPGQGFSCFSSIALITCWNTLWLQYICNPTRYTIFDD